MKLAVIIFMCIVAVVCTFTLIVVIWELTVSKRDREADRKEASRRRAEEAKERKRRKEEDASIQRAREAEIRAMQAATFAQESAAQAMNNVIANNSASKGKTVSLGPNANIQSFRT